MMPPFKGGGAQNTPVWHAHGPKRQASGPATAKAASPHPTAAEHRPCADGEAWEPWGNRPEAVEGGGGAWNLRESEGHGLFRPSTSQRQRNGEWDGPIGRSELTK